MKRLKLREAVAFCFLCAALLAAVLDGQPSEAGGSGQALLFSDNIASIAPFHDMPTDELTFEAWVQTSDSCHTGAIMSYAAESSSTNPNDRVRDFNSFVIWDIRDLLACRDFELLDSVPDPEGVSCRTSFVGSKSERTMVNIADGDWHHLAVTWSSRKNGLTTIYVDGMKRAESETGKTTPIKPGGALVLGAEQDCYGGCFEKDQAFYGYMDEVRIWKKARTHSEILKYMRYSGDRIDDIDLVAHWKFDDPMKDRGVMVSHFTAEDSSGRGNSLNIITRPKQAQDSVEYNGKNLGFPALDFDNNYAIQPFFQGMPDKDFTIEFWARTEAVSDSVYERVQSQEIFSFAAYSPGDGDLNNDGGNADSGFMDDAILIEKYNTEFKGTGYLDKGDISTIGSLSVHINANREGYGYGYDSWIDFPVGWVDDKWHHIAVTWKHSDGKTQLFFDGEEQTPFWSSKNHALDNNDPSKGGVEPYISAGMSRSMYGSLVLGQNQECFAGCFSPSMAYHGSLAELRIWDRVQSSRDIKDKMTKTISSGESGLTQRYDFRIYNDALENAVDTQLSDGAVVPRTVNNLDLGGTGPTWQLSYAPLETADGLPVGGPKAGSAGYALMLDDKQVLMLENFQDFPSTELTLEFWMWSVDTCRQGTPFSYATGGYEVSDNSFLLFDYNDWGVAVMEDEGTMADHHAGLSATDGKWHHIAVTWKSSTGETVLYDNGRRVWTVKRGQGKFIPSGGTLVIGREQDCVGGCFDSDAGAKGDTQAISNLEYGSEDFFGMIEEMRLWRTVRTEDQINEGIQADDGRTKTHGYDNPGISATDPDLVAYWKFDAGSGYVVKDMTGRGHDLRMSYQPQWRVVNWLSICGNGIVEGGEMCDDGNRISGDGCSNMCIEEEGWWCTMENPSVCSRLDSHDKYDKQTDPKDKDSSYTPSYPDSSGGSSSRGGSSSYDPYVPKADTSTKKSHSSHAGLISFFFIVFVLAGLTGVAYVKRYEIYDRFPKVKETVDNVCDKLNVNRNREYGMLHLDPDESDILAPEFVGMQPSPGTYKPPQPQSPSPRDSDNNDVPPNGANP